MILLEQLPFEYGRARRRLRIVKFRGVPATEGFHDFTIRRGTMPMRGIDSRGPVFRERRQAWAAAGQPYYKPLPDTAGSQS